MSKAQNFPDFVSAVHDNRKLWSVLAADVAQTENGLSDELRGRIFWLAEFVEAESRKLLRGQGDVSVLIEINAMILQGLRQTKEDK